MRSTCAVSVALGILAALLAGPLVAVAWAQALPTPGPSTPPAQPAGGGGAAVVIVLLVLGIVLVIGAGGKLIDLKRRREDESLHLQSRISDALLLDRALSGLPITPTVHVPFWRGSPATIEVSGRVPASDARQAVLRIIEQEASRVRSDFRIEDRLAVTPSTGAHAA